MYQRSPITAADFFSNSASREAGLTDEFWFRVYTLYMDKMHNTPGVSFNGYDIEQTLRVPFGQGHVDVLVRSQPHPREEEVFRFTAFAAGDEDEVRQMSRAYRYNDDRAVLGEAVLPDGNMRW